MEYFGKITIIDVLNPANLDFPRLEADQVKVVHYPDCQQLLLWLPKEAHAYDRLICIDENSSWICLEHLLSDYSFGVNKVILDTLIIPSGKGVIHFQKNHENKHSILYSKSDKNEENFGFAGSQTNPESEVDFPFTYRDGLGRPIPDEDVMMRQQSFENLSKFFSSKLTFHTTGRDGYIEYLDQGKVARFDYEMGGGNFMIFILIPPDFKWQEATGFTLEEKEEIVDHLARMTQRDYVGGATFSIENDSIIFYRK